MSNRDLLARQLTSQRDEPLRLRQGVVDTDNGDGTVNVTEGGSSVSIANVARLASYTPTVGDTVWILANGPDRLVLGKLA